MPKVLLAFPMKDQETGIAIKEALEANKCKVTSLDADRQIKELFNEYNMQDGDFDCVLMSRTVNFYDDMVRIKKYHGNKSKLIVWNTDVRDSIEKWGRLLYMFGYADYYFDGCEGAIEEYRKKGIKAKYLPQGLDHRRYFPMKPTQWMKREYGCTVGFIGNIVQHIHHEREQFLRTLPQVGVQFKHFNKMYKDDHNYCVACSKVNLAMSIRPELKNYYSVRDWKILGAGGVLMERHHPGIEEYFNGYVTPYNDINDFLAKLQEIMNNYGEYEKKAKEAAKWVKKNHTYKHRIKEMLEIVL